MPGLIVEHEFASSKADSEDASVVRPSDWNAPLKVTPAGVIKAIFDLSGVSERMLLFTGAETAGLVQTTGFGRSLLNYGDATSLLAALGAAALLSPEFTGTPKAPTAAPGTNTTQIATTAFVHVAFAALVGTVPSTLDTLQEFAAALGNDPNFATTIATQLGLKAPLASPAFTGTPTAPTPAAAENSTKIATTAFVQGELAAKAPLASPAFTGNPTAPTPAPGDSDTSIATTAFVSAAVAAAGASYSIGAIRNLTGANGASPANQMSFASDAVILRNSAGQPTFIGAPGTKTCDINGVGPLAGGRDQAGAFTNSVWLHFWYIWNGATLAVTASLSATAPTLPSGYTHYAYICAVYRDGTGTLRAVYVRGGKVYYSFAQQVYATSGAYSNAMNSVATWVPPNATEFDAKCIMFASATGSGGNNFYIGPLSGVAYLELGCYAVVGGDSPSDGGTVALPNISQQIFTTAIQAGGVTLNTTVWITAYAVSNGAQ